MRQLNNNTSLLHKLRQIETLLFQFAASLCGTNQITGFSEYRLLTMKEINKYTYFTVIVMLFNLNAFEICTYRHNNVFTNAPPGNQLLLYVASVVK